ncbi:dehydratase [Rhodococcus ruber Chol-4]|uniref:L-carnitine dehydratase/bile acid-inducible protein F n=2 Tax=Rhodococcus ruber TaxID=1830 RepID=A0A098BE79_9NOCA|nr:MULTISPECIES: CoA transferase [Rhodococcus]MDX5313065.1 CoA transferase [Rhodococcus sp. (in: high G+C Gram-positive bacteria)]RIK03615.1 MAG: 2-methylfumaryl-CoA isomerase [Acidobacteriota bacterium]AWH01291.1 2-methylfumaryl-CoA isomerase [Rhodococcus ruber]AXY54634.1 dehydratase [Rhodococcus ruber]KXF85522.1 dehydratase [Rhodococcus ruber Chol-4]
MNPTASIDELPSSTAPLAGVRVVEVSSFIAAPLCGMTLAQLGAEVVRVDPIGGAADYHRWPVTDDGESIYWAGLNKGKRSFAADFRDPEAHSLIRDLITDAGVLVTNAAGRDWLDYDSLAAIRPDLIHVQVLGRADGGSAVDYTVNAAAGFPLATGPVGHDGPVNHLLPAWDLACGLYAALSVASAVHRREVTGAGAKIVLPLEDVALATAGNLGYLAEAQLGGPERDRIGNSVYGTYGRDFTTSDGASFMVVALTPRHFRDLTDLTGTTTAVGALESALGADFRDEGDRYRHREVLDALFAVWFREHTAAEVATSLAGTSILHERYRTFAEIAKDPRVTANPMFQYVDQPRVGGHLAPSLPMSFDGIHPTPRPAPANGDDTAAVLAEHLGLTPQEIDRLATDGTIRVPAGTLPALEKDLAV